MQHSLTVSRHKQDQIKIKFDSAKYLYLVNREAGDEFHCLLLTKEQAEEIAEALLNVAKRVPEQRLGWQGKVHVE